MPSADLQDDEAGKAADLARLRRLAEAVAANPERTARIAASDRRSTADPAPAEAGNPAKSATPLVSAWQRRPTPAAPFVPVKRHG